MAAYILRRLLLIIPTLIGIMLVNFTLTQFVPGGPIEQVIAKVQGEGDALRIDLRGSGYRCDAAGCVAVAKPTSGSEPGAASPEMRSVG